MIYYLFIAYLSLALNPLSMWPEDDLELLIVLSGLWRAEITASPLMAQAPPLP